MGYSEQEERKLFFYATQPMYQTSLGEWENERDAIRLKGSIPRRMQDLVRRIEDVCDDMDYDGSMMYDEIPDKERMWHICRRIRQESDWEEEIPDEVTMTLLIKEMEKRRFKRRKCNNWW